MTNRPVDPTPHGSDLATVLPSGTAAVGTVGAYRLLERIGEGGMGEVWLAEQTQPVRRQVALKIIKAGMDTEQVVARFEAERQALALMDHQAISRVFDGGATPQGRPYFAMEYVRGEPINTYANRHNLPIADRLELMIEVCEGVQHAHQKGVIHRDLKPSNVLVTVRDDRPVPKIIDFGVAKATTQTLTDRTLHTQLGALVGTLEYMSPEQAGMGALDIDTRTDVYALGVILYELLTGTLPVDATAMRAKGLEEGRRIIREVDPPLPSSRVASVTSGGEGAHTGRRASELAKQLRGDLDWIVMRALEKDRTRRYGSASDLAADLRRHLNDVPVLASPPSRPYRARKFVRRHRLGVAAAAVAVILAGAFVATMAVQTGRITRERDRANREAEAANQVAKFLVGLFNVTDPSEARGNTLTAREILARGAGQVEASLSQQPALQARLEATIGQVYTSLGLYAEAQRHLVRALTTQRRVNGDDHLETLATIHSLANLYWYQGKYVEAEPLYVEVIQQRQRVLGPDHPDTLRTQYDLSSSYTMQERWDKSEPIARATMDAQSRVLGPDHPDTLATANEIQAMYFKQGRYADAAPIAQRVLAGVLKSSGPGHPTTLQAMNNLAGVLENTGRLDEAERLFLDTLDGKRKVQGERHPDTAFSKSRLAGFYIRQRKFESAEPLAIAAYQDFLNSEGAAGPRAQRSLTQVRQLYDTWNKPHEAAEWRKKK